MDDLMSPKVKELLTALEQELKAIKPGQPKIRKTKKYYPKVINYLDDSEFLTFLRSCDRLTVDPLWHYRIEYFRLIVWTGGRKSEIAALEVKHCHERYIEIVNGKGNKYRTADVHPCGIPYYHAYLNERRGHKWMFPGRKLHKCGWGLYVDHVSMRRVSEWWDDFCDLVGLRKIGLHGLRRTFATWCAEELSMKDLQDQLGHEKERTTDQFYRASIPGRKFYKPLPRWREYAEAQIAAMMEQQNVIQISGWKK